MSAASSPPSAPVLHARLPLSPWADAMTARLPGLQPLGDLPWLVRDEAFAGQMALRDDLVESRRESVIATTPGSEAAQRELLAAVLHAVSADPGYRREHNHMIRPDGASVSLQGEPLAVAGRLAQEDFCLLLPRDGQHMLVAACVCFPASWTLSQKIGRPLGAIHDPVARYDDALNQRIERIFSNLTPANPMWRANWLRYNSTALHHPLKEYEHRPFDPAGPFLVRVERQTLRRLPESGAIVFAIHTFLVLRDALTPEQAQSLDLAVAGR